MFIVGVMTEALKIAGSALSRAGDAPRGYQDVREVKARAAVAQSSDSPEERQAVARLNQVLESGKPLDAEVPRGFYLNIQV